jgi:glycosyltransferase involved in cell wall biosynthesis
MIFTLNEEIHLPSCLASLQWCDDIIVVDSFSTDKTEEICRSAGVRFFQNRFEGFGRQRNWAIANTNPKHSWVLILDADERVTPELAEEMAGIVPLVSETVGAFRLKRRFYMWGRWLKYSSLYPTWMVRLIHKDRVRYINRGHAETQEVKGEILELQHDLIDENLKGISEWFERQNRYSTKDAEFEISQETAPMPISALLDSDPLARRAALKQLATHLPGRHFWYFLYGYVIRGGFLDGRDGFMFCMMKSQYQSMVNIKKYHMKKENNRK